MLLRRASLITRLFSSSPLVRSRCMRAATSSRSQFLASVCIREPRDGQGVRDAMRGGLRVAQLGSCLVLHAASRLYARFRQVGRTQPQMACADYLQTLLGVVPQAGHPALKTPLLAILAFLALTLTLPLLHLIRPYLSSLSNKVCKTVIPVLGPPETSLFSFVYCLR